MLPFGGRGSDRGAAICSPLPCTGLVSHTLCFKLAAGAYMGGFLSSVNETCSACRHDFCGPNVVNHFFCDLPPVPVLSCSDIPQPGGDLPRGCGRWGVLSVLVVLISCGCTAAAVLTIRSAKGRTKAFSTCASHLAAGTLFSGSGLLMCTRPSSSYSLDGTRWCPYSLLW